MCVLSVVSTTLITSPPAGVQSIVINVSVCLSVCSSKFRQIFCAS